MSTYEKARGIFCQIMEISPDALPEEISPDTVSNWDSIMHLNLVLALEDEFDMEFDEDEVGNLLSLNAFVKSIDQANA